MKSTNSETKAKSTNYMGQILYNYIKERNDVIKSFNRFNFNRDLDGNFKPRPGCDYSEPVELIQWNDLVTNCNNLTKEDADKVKAANKKVYEIYMSMLDEQVFSLLDEMLGFKL